MTTQNSFHDTITAGRLCFKSESSNARAVTVTISTSHESVPLSFNTVGRHSGVEMSTESDRSAVFDGVSGGDCLFFFLSCLTFTKPPSLPGSFSRYTFADMTVGWLVSTCRRF